MSRPGRLLIEAAQVEAAALGHQFVGLEHLLLALLADPELEAVASRIRPLPGREELRRRLGATGSPRGVMGSGEFRLSPQARRVLEAAERSAVESGGTGPDRGWILERILAHPRGPLADILGGGARAKPGPPGEDQGVPAARPRERSDPRATEGPPAGRGAPTRESSRAPGSDRRTRTEKKTTRDVPARPPRPVPPPKPPRPAPRAPGGLRIPVRALLLAAVPASVVLNLLHAHPLIVFLTACLAVVPLAGYMGEATEHLAARTGPAIGGLLNATFGNAAELIIGIVALRAGFVDLVKASITGSILGNLLLIMGLAFIAGGTGRPVLRFNRVSAGASAGMLALAVVGLVFPALFHSLHPEAGRLTELRLSESVAVVLAVTYGFSLLFSLRTHKSLFSGDPHPTAATIWAPPMALGVLALATVGVVVESEILVHAVEDVTATMGFSETFLGLIVVPIIGNAAEHAAAVVVARKGQMDLSLQIALGSSTQVALLVAPILVLVGVLMGRPMNLVFTSFEVAALGLTTVITAIITLDGESHWFEGVQLLATYALIGATAFFL